MTNEPSKTIEIHMHPENELVHIAYTDLSDITNTKTYHITRSDAKSIKAFLKTIEDVISKEKS